MVVEKLKEKTFKENIIAIVRSPNEAKTLGVEAREGDYEKPETLRNALEGIDKLLLISGSEVGKRVEQHQNVIEAAKDAGVKSIVYTSILHADSSIIDLAEEHRATEAGLGEAGIPFTLLRNSWYTENYTNSIPGALAGGAFIGSAGDGKISSATREDFAEAAAVVLTEEGHEGKTYELAGDEAYTLDELAEEISKQTGKEIPYKNLPPEEYAKALKNFGVPGGLAEAIAGWDVAASKGALHDDSRQLSTLIGRPTTSPSTAVADALKKQ